MSLNGVYINNWLYCMMRKKLCRNAFSLICLLIVFALSACQRSEASGDEESGSVDTAIALPLPEVKVHPTNTISQPGPELIIEATTVPEIGSEPDALSLLEAEQTDEAVFDYPESHYISGIAGHAQHYYLSCESSAAVDWAWFFGVNIYESTFQTDMPRSDNPDLGYVGDFTTREWGQIPPYSYGVHAEPIAEGLRAYDLPAVAVKGYSLDEVKQKLAQDKPIIAWIIGNLEYSEPVEYVDKAGNAVIVAPYEHVVILTGYNAESIRYMNNGKFFDAPTDVFLTSFGVLGNMVVVFE